MIEKHDSYYIKKYMDDISQNFEEYLLNTPPDLLAGTNLNTMRKEFYDTLRLDQTSSKKYYKIITMNKLFRQPIVHSFILKRDVDKFYHGDILLTEFHRNPYYDKSYGNIFGEYKLNWHRILPLDNT
jgi:hypothetical protein